MIAPRAQRPVAILGGVRLPFVKAGTAFARYTALDLMGECLTRLADRYELKGKAVGEVVVGSTFYLPETWNFAREAVFRSGLSPTSPGTFVQRACATSLDAAIVAAQKVASGRIDVAIAGGAESLSNVPVYYEPKFARRLQVARGAKDWRGRFKAFRGFSPKELVPQIPPVSELTTGLSMGEHCELMVKEWKITRGAQDELALASHQKGAKAYQSGFFRDLIVPFAGVEKDSNLRPDTSLEKLTKLPPVFDRSPAGTLSAGNSSPLSDGAACVLLASEEWAKAHGFPVRAYLTDWEHAAVDIKSEGLLMAPAYAVPPMLRRNGLALQDFDFYEIHEAFAGQVLCTLAGWESEKYCRERLGVEKALGKIDRSKLNVVGGSVALGHPFGATGARILATAAKLLDEKGSGKALLSVCTGGGMGTVAVVEK
jgi:acetyl-CoA C-acetyltransferase